MATEGSYAEGDHLPTVVLMTPSLANIMATLDLFVVNVALKDVGKTTKGKTFMEQGPGQFHFDPETYLEMVISEVPAYGELEDRTAEATVGFGVGTILDLGTGTGETAVRVAERHPTAHLLGIDKSGEMLTHARRRLPEADFAIARLEDPLPPGPFDLVVSALAVHHLDGPGKADLFERIAERLVPGGRFVMADVVVPDNPNDAITPIDGLYDKPSRVVDLLKWLGHAGFDSHLIWTKQDLALFVGERSS